VVGGTHAGGLYMTLALLLVSLLVVVVDVGHPGMTPALLSKQQIPSTLCVATTTGSTSTLPLLSDGLDVV
jgi:hypothetical protein